MTNRFIESFDHYTTMSQKWAVVTPGAGGSSVISAAGKRTGINGLTCNAPAGANLAQFTPPGLPTKVTYFFGFALQVTSLPTAANGPIAFTSDGVTAQGSLNMSVNGQLLLMRGRCSDGTIVAASTRSIMLNTWNYIEFKHTVDNVAGILEVRVNGEVWATFNGNTRTTGVNQITAVSIGGFPAVGLAGRCNFFVDDVYVNDSDGAAPNNTYWGDTQVEARVPTGNSPTYQEWPTLVGAASHWQAVSEIPPTEDTSYVMSTTVGERDLYTRAAITPAAATINSLQVVTRARKDVAGAASFARMYRRAATDNQGADAALSTSYLNYLEVMETDPIAVGVWTVANVNAAEFGVRTR